VFALIFLFAFMSSFIIGGAYWKVSTGDYAMAMKLQKVCVSTPIYIWVYVRRRLTLIQTGGAIFFVLALLGWYITVVMMAAEMRITVNLPVGDLSHLWPVDVELAEMEKRE
jgi:hypothetical protein